MRRKSRELALQILFQREFAPQISTADLLDVFENTEGYSKDLISYADNLIQGVVSHKDSIDSLISKTSAHWKIDRMTAVDRNLLRIAIFEILFSQEKLTPGIAINEAVELAKVFGTTDSASFINGILDQVAKQGR